MDSKKRWPRPADDAARVAALHELGVLDQPADADLEAVARVASYVCGTPTAVINLIDQDRQWQPAAHGFDRGEVTRDESMCGWAILSPDVTYTPDASLERLFADNPFVTGRLGMVRLYASAPVTIDTGHVVGTLCAFSEEPGDLSAVQLERLRDLATAAARILELRRTAAAFARAATSDPLTGLPNRAIFKETLRRSLDRQARGLGRPGLVYIDLDEFKPVNDRHGHTAGDLVLCTVATRLVENVGESDVVARLGGDEFAVLVDEDAEQPLESRLRDLAVRLIEALATPAELEDGTIVSIGASIGLAVPEGEDDTPETMIARADTAMYVEKTLARPGRRHTDP